MEFAGRQRIQMEPTEVWPGIDLALHELDLMCSEGIDYSYVKQVPERSRVLQNDLNFTSNTGKCHDRYLMPSQAWNRPGILAEVEGLTSQNEGLRNNNQSTDGENTENSYSVKGSKVVKISDPKGGVVFGNGNPYSPCRSGIRENEGLSVLRMNSHYMTGVSITTAGALGAVFGQMNSYARLINTHGTPKHRFLAQPVRHHHMRPYEVPWRRGERARTKSETAEKEAAMKLIDRIDVSLNYPVEDNYSKSNNATRRRSLLKSRSLENVRLAEDEILQVPVQEMDSMSNRIQRLHVNE